ncbi:hypothetical protein Tco_1364168, partial [Tanacetum coccineum]
HLAQAKAEAKAYRRELHEVLGVLKTDPRMAELLSQGWFPRVKMGSVSRNMGVEWSRAEYQRMEWRGRSGEDGSGEDWDDDEGK